MSFLPVLEYVGGLAVFGFVYWIMDDILAEILDVGYPLMVTGQVYNLYSYLWVAIIVIYLIFGGWWLVRKFNEQQYQQGGW